MNAVSRNWSTNGNAARALGSEDVVTPEELEIGQLLVKHNRATQNQVNKCLEIQDKLSREGRTPLPRLGELLVSYGYVDAGTIDELLRLQRRPAGGSQ